MVKGRPMKFVLGHNSRTPEQRQLSAELRRRATGEKHPNWVGDRVDYSALHHWLNRHYEKSGVCEECGRNVGSAYQRGTHWANVSGEYRREDRADWRELCPKCHHGFDHEKRAAKAAQPKED